MILRHYAIYLILIVSGMLQAGECSPCLSGRGILLLSHPAYVLCKLFATWLCPCQKRPSIIELEALHRLALFLRCDLEGLAKHLLFMPQPIVVRVSLMELLWEIGLPVLPWLFTKTSQRGAIDIWRSIWQ